VGVGVTTLAQVRDGLFTRLDTIVGLRVYKGASGNVEYPAAVIYPPTTVDYRDDLGFGSYPATFVVMLSVPATVDRKQLDLYPFLDRTGASSIFAAVETDRSLGGLNVDARVVSAADPLDLGEMAGTKVYQRAVIVEVIVS
jgi:hypothetical protein